MLRARWGSLLLFLLPCAASAASTTTTATVAVDPTAVQLHNVFGVVELMTRAFKSHAWALAAGLLLTLTVAIIRWFEIGKRVPDRWVPWLTLALSVATSAAIGLQRGLSLWSVLSTGLLVGVAAVGGWESVGKMLRGVLGAKEVIAVPVATIEPTVVDRPSPYIPPGSGTGARRPGDT